MWEISLSVCSIYHAAAHLEKRNELQELRTLRSGSGRNLNAYMQIQCHVMS